MHEVLIGRAGGFSLIGATRPDWQEWPTLGMPTASGLFWRWANWSNRLT